MSTPYNPKFDKEKIKAKHIDRFGEKMSGYWWCGKYTQRMSHIELERHHCFHRQKGKRKGRKCSYLVKIEREVVR